MKPEPQGDEDAPFDGPPLPGVGERPTHLIDAPRIDREQPPERGFNWKPTLVLIAVGGAALVAYAYL